MTSSLAAGTGTVVFLSSGVASFFASAAASGFFSSGFFSSAFGSSFFSSAIFTSSLSGGNRCGTSLRSATANRPVVRLVAKLNSTVDSCGANSRSLGKNRYLPSGSHAGDSALNSGSVTRRTWPSFSLQT